MELLYLNLVQCVCGIHTMNLSLVQKSEGVILNELVLDWWMVFIIDFWGELSAFPLVIVTWKI
jgi:hypothetical protein